MRTLRLVFSILAWPFLLVGGTLFAYLWPLVTWLFSERLRFSISEGDLFEVSLPLRVFVLTHWRAPYTGGFKCTLPVGVHLRAVTAAPKELSRLSIRSFRALRVSHSFRASGGENQSEIQRG